VYTTLGAADDASLQVPDATNCNEPPVPTDAVLGEIAIAVRVGGTAADIVTAADADMPHTHVAITLNVPPTLPAVKRPVALILPPEAEYVTVGARVAPSFHVAVAVNCCVAPAAKVTGFGVTVSDVIDGSTVTGTAVCPVPSVVTIDVDPTLTAVTSPLADTVDTDVLLLK